MITRHIDIDNNKWGILLILDFDTYYDAHELGAIMQSFGMRKSKVKEALNILSTYNSGMAISNFGLKMSAVFIGKATKASQFWNSIAHEMRHVSDAILDYYGDEWDGSEPPAYLDGYIFQKVVEKIAQPCY